MKHLVCTLAMATALIATSCQSPAGSQQSAVSTSDSTQLAIAYINTDSLLKSYDYAKKLNDSMNDKIEKMRVDLNQQRRSVDQDAYEFQRKVNNNAFASMERAQSESNRIQKRAQELQEQEQKLSYQLQMESANISEALMDTLTNFLSEYAKGRYKVVLHEKAEHDLVLYAVPGLDITMEVTEALNKRYAAAQK